MSKPRRHYEKWRIRWIDENGKRQSAVCDEYREAEHQLRQRQLEAEEIRRGMRPPKPEDHPFGRLCDYWLEKRAPRKRSKKDDESIIRKHLRPAFGERLVREVAAVERIDDYVTEREHLSKKTLNNHLTLLGTMLGVAVELGWLAKVPKINKPRVPLFSTDYAYLRSQDEIRRLLVAAQPEGELVFTLYSTAVFTGERKGELATQEWSDVDFERRLIAVQRSFNGPVKAERVRYVPILDALLPVLRAWRLRCPGRLVFPNHAGNVYDESARIFEETLHRVLDRAGFPKVTKNGKDDAPYITFHGLRHTFASHWMTNGGDLFKLQKILGHQTVEMTMRYAHLAPEAFAVDHARLGAALLLEPAKIARIGS